SSRTRPEDRGGRVERVAIVPHIMHAEPGRAERERDHVRSDGPCIPLSWLRHACQLSNEPFARCANHHLKVKLGQSCEMRKCLHGMLGTLGESDTRIEYDPVTGNPRRERCSCRGLEL